MKAHAWIGAMFVGLLMSGTAVAGDVYQIDPAHSTVGFAVRHLGLAHVHGTFHDVSGTIVYNEQDISRSSARAVIKAASIDTDNEKRDQHLRSDDFFAADQFPDIMFESVRIEPQGDGYACIGTLMMRGVSKEIAIPFTVVGTIQDAQGKTRLGVEGETTLDRQDFGIAWNKAMEGGGLVVGNKIKVTLNIEAIKE